MGSVSRGRSRKGGWGGTLAADGMSAWAWLVGALLLMTLVTASVARPPIVASGVEEAGLSEEPPTKCQSSKPSVCSVHPGDLLKLSCRLPKAAAIVWTKDGASLSPDNRTLIEREWLHIRDAVPRDSGLYACRPASARGGDTLCFIVNVTDALSSGDDEDDAERSDDVEPDGENMPAVLEGIPVSKSSCSRERARLGCISGSLQRAHLCGLHHGFMICKRRLGVLIEERH